MGHSSGNGAFPFNTDSQKQSHRSTQETESLRDQSIPFYFCKGFTVIVLACPNQYSCIRKNLEATLEKGQIWNN